MATLTTGTGGGSGAPGDEADAWHDVTSTAAVARVAQADPGGYLRSRGSRRARCPEDQATPCSANRNLPCRRRLGSTHGTTTTPAPRPDDNRYARRQHDEPGTGENRDRRTATGSGFRNPTQVDLGGENVLMDPAVLGKPGVGPRCQHAFGARLPSQAGPELHEALG